MLCFSLLAQAPKPAGTPFDRPEIILGSAGLVAALLLGAFAIFLVDRWRKRSALADVADAGRELTNFRAMYERGEITEEEYTRLRHKVSERVKPAEAAPATGGMAGRAEETRASGSSATETTRGPMIPGPLPPEYFDDPGLPDRSPGGDRPPGERPPPA